MYRYSSTKNKNAVVIYSSNAIPNQYNLLLWTTIQRMLKNVLAALFHMKVNEDLEFQND